MCLSKYLISYTGNDGDDGVVSHAKIIVRWLPILWCSSTFTSTCRSIHEFVKYVASRDISSTMQGRVGVNTDKPEEALTVNGNIQLTGQILQASDIRVKQDIRQVRTDSMS